MWHPYNENKHVFLGQDSENFSRKPTKIFAGVGPKEKTHRNTVSLHVRNAIKTEFN